MCVKALLQKGETIEARQKKIAQKGFYQLT